MKRRHVLETIADCEDIFGSLTTNAQCSRRDVMRCVKAGLVESAGMVRVMDGDFVKEPEQFREGFKLSAIGRSTLQSIGG